MKVKLTKRGEEIVKDLEIPRRVRTKFNAVVNNKEQKDLEIKSSDGKKCQNCDIINKSNDFDSCVDCRYDW